MSVFLHVVAHSFQTIHILFSSGDKYLVRFLNEQLSLSIFVHYEN